MPPLLECCIHGQWPGRCFCRGAFELTFFESRNPDFQTHMSSRGTVLVEMACFFLIACGIVAPALLTCGVIASNVDQVGKASLAEGETIPTLRGATEQGEFEKTGRAPGADSMQIAGMTQVRPRRLAKEVLKCPPAAKPGQQTVPLDRYSLEAKFDCGILADPAIQVEPACTPATDKCCDSAGAKCDKTIMSVVGVNGSVSMNDSSKVFTVKLDDTPQKPAEKLHFKCKKESNQTCIVAVEMPAPLGAGQCSFDKNVQLAPIAEPNKEAKFECGGTLKTPPTDAQVYKGPDCSGEPAALSALVPGAKLTKGDNGAFTLSVAELPSQPQYLCFKCEYPDPRKTKENQTATCKVTVAVSGTSQTTTASTTTSAAHGIALTWFGALAFAFLSSTTVQ
ncbi:sag-related sequence srs53c [Cystoisospora suis]|uniref:Sag-related sequence srs53c n=1 Tax=Cystoisospora suis TaxID=483139 RepID=A0A2C6KPT9_9APIC|nr:sag-related sequence srs53c [Cystoisospora suis]